MPPRPPGGGGSYRYGNYGPTGVRLAQPVYRDPPTPSARGSAGRFWLGVSAVGLLIWLTAPRREQQQYYNAPPPQPQYPPPPGPPPLAQPGWSPPASGANLYWDGQRWRPMDSGAPPAAPPQQ
eukprot:TRINITY_DN31988_c0_g1_i1.p3 TRINITY_DN31988_c0_g1~~TRINITY_DN31988_c0_g1_i1.p3  ORF type:complete len:123 (+),score=18.31 TRINITY_DN31988_c0_g1_i1:150-518(+)